MKVIRVSKLDPLLKCTIQNKYPHLDSVSLSKHFPLHGTQRAEGMTSPAGQCSGLLEFHDIVTGLVNSNDVILICKILSSWYIEHLRSYEFVEPHCAEIVALDPDVPTDYRPAYKVYGKLMVTTRSFILH